MGIEVVVGIASLVVGAASAIYSGVQQGKITDAEEEQQKLNNKATLDSAISAYGDMSAADRDSQEAEQEQGIAAQAQYIQDVGRVNVMSGSSGTYGGSVDVLLRDLATTRGRNVTNIIKNRETEIDDFQRQAESIRYGARANMQTRVFNKPSALGIGLSAVGAGAQGYAAGSSFGKGAKEAGKATSGAGFGTEFGSGYKNPSGPAQRYSIL